MSDEERQFTALESAVMSYNWLAQQGWRKCSTAEGYCRLRRRDPEAPNGLGYTACAVGRLIPNDILEFDPAVSHEARGSGMSDAWHAGHRDAYYQGALGELQAAHDNSSSPEDMEIRVCEIVDSLGGSVVDGKARVGS